MPRAGIVAAQPALRFIPPAYTPWLQRLARLLLPLLLRSRGIARCQFSGGERLAHLFGDVQAGRIRLLIAFRHPSTTDPLVMAQLLWREVPAAARREGLRLRRTVHCQFLYDRGIPLWAGAAVGWVLARLGGVPIQRGKLDRNALRTARDLFAHGPFPLAIAPEGATNNQGELLGPLEPGIAQMAFWCCEDLAAERRDERVLIVPVGLRYRSIDADWAPIDRLLAELEAQVGLPPATAAGEAGAAERRYGRLIGLAERLLALLETFYRHTYGRVLDGVGAAQAGAAASEPPFQLRLARLREVALAVAESHFNLSAKGSIYERCRRIEQAAWDCIYRDDLETLAPVERGLADWEAIEAGIRMGHMRLVEHFACVSGSYVAEKPSVDRYGEMLLILWHALAWIRGREGERPPDLGPRQVSLRLGEPIDVSARAGAYAEQRRRAIAALTADLEDRLQGLIAT
jgi:1-acyl-sn-glycerol-3-phosphate acyltransferase